MKIFNSKSTKDLRKSLCQEMPKAEQILWFYLRNKGLGTKFRRQFGIGAYVVDFYCPEFKLAIEVDGDSHVDDAIRVYDHHREKIIKDFGIQLLRFTNIEIYEAIESVIERIESKLRSQNPL